MLEAIEKLTLKDNESIIDDIVSCQRMVKELLTKDVIAVDIEGVNLCRDGKISVIQLIDEEENFYLVDITTLKKKAFTEGNLKKLLEDKNVTKVVFDGRADNDALHHLYNVTMVNAYDLQVLYALKFSHQSDRFVKGLQKVLKASKLVSSNRRRELDKIKDTGRSLFAPELGGSYEVWEQRPLRDELIEYAICDVKYMLPMKHKWNGSSRMERKVKEITKTRISKAIHSNSPAKGRQMCIRDFKI